MSLLSHQNIPSFSTQQDLSNGVSLTWGTSETGNFVSFSGEMSGVDLPVTFQASPATHLPLPRIQNRTR
jgi:hypothetical protein